MPRQEEEMQEFSLSVDLAYEYFDLVLTLFEAY